MNLKQLTIKLQEHGWAESTNTKSTWDGLNYQDFTKNGVILRAEYYPHSPQEVVYIGTIGYTPNLIGDPHFVPQPDGTEKFYIKMLQEVKI